MKGNIKYWMCPAESKTSVISDINILSFSVHPSLPLVATSSGQRHFTLPGDSSDSDSEESNATPSSHSEDNSLRIWSFKTWSPTYHVSGLHFFLSIKENEYN